MHFLDGENTLLEENIAVNRRLLAVNDRRDRTVVLRRQSKQPRDDPSIAPEATRGTNMSTAGRSRVRTGQNPDTWRD